MAGEGAFAPGAFRIETGNDERVRLVGEREDGERQEIVLDRSQLPAVLREIQEQIGDESAASLGALSLGKDVRVAGLGFFPEPDQFRLTAYLEVPDQRHGVEISLRLCRADLVNCVAAMTDWLKHHRADG
jgi:hypothetical protein